MKGSIVCVLQCPAAYSWSKDCVTRSAARRLSSIVIRWNCSRESLQTGVQPLLVWHKINNNKKIFWHKCLLLNSRLHRCWRRLKIFAWFVLLAEMLGHCQNLHCLTDRKMTLEREKVERIKRNQVGQKKCSENPQNIFKNPETRLLSGENGWITGLTAQKNRRAKQAKRWTGKEESASSSPQSPARLTS